MLFDFGSIACDNCEEEKHKPNSNDDVNFWNLEHQVKLLFDTVFEDTHSMEKAIHSKRSVCSKKKLSYLGDINVPLFSFN